MDIGEAMGMIAEEAERQGFQVRQLSSGLWQFRKGGDNLMFTVSNVPGVLTMLGVLIAHGLDWSYKD